MSPSLTLPQAVEAHAELMPDAAAILSYEGVPISWSRLVLQLERTREDLANLGLEANDRVAIILPDGPLLAVAFLAVSSCAACAPINPGSTSREISLQLASVSARALIIADGAVSDSIAEMCGRLDVEILRIKEDEAALGSFTLLGRPTSPRFPRTPVTPENVALILHTSGTTGHPKLVPLRHRNLLASAHNMAESLALSAQDRCVNLMPLFHVHGLVGGLIGPLVAGGSSVCPPTCRPEAFFLALRNTRPTWYTGVPTMHRAILTAADPHRELIERNRLRFIRSCSASLPPTLLIDLSRVFQAPVVEAYGMTEASHQISTNPVGAGEQRPGTVGIAGGHINVAIVSDTGQRLEAGTVGEVVVRGPSVITEYEANPEANARSFFEGWFRTGDLGQVDTNGYLTLAGRLKDQVNRGGEKISPIEIDQILLSHPDVVEAAAFGVAHPSLGEDIRAAVVLRPGSTTTPADLHALLLAELAAFKVPRAVFVLEALPKGPSGKVQRRDVANAVAGLDRDRSRLPSSQIECEVASIWERVLACSSVGVDDDFFDLGGDSLSINQMLSEVEASTGRSVPAGDFFRTPTLRRLTELIGEEGASEISRLRRCVAEAGANPFFFFHGDYEGRGYYTRRLATLLQDTANLVPISARFNVEESVPRSIEDIAEAHAEQLRKAYTQGPFLIGGYCNGALVALEVARALVASGRDVETVAMIDVPTFNARPAIRALHHALGQIRTTKPRLAVPLSNKLDDAGDFLWRTATKTERFARSRPYRQEKAVILRNFLARAAAKPFSRASRASQPLSVPIKTMHLGESGLRPRVDHRKLYSRLMRRYVPGPIPVRVLYLSAGSDGRPLAHITPELEVVDLSSHHFNCLSLHVEEVAGILRARLNLQTPPDTSGVSTAPTSHVDGVDGPG